MALTLSVSARPDGPDNGGASVLLTVQPAAARTASAIAARWRNVKDMALEVPKISELDLKLSRRLNRVTDAVDAVDRDPRDHGYEIRTGPELGEWSFLLGD